MTDMTAERLQPEKFAYEAAAAETAKQINRILKTAPSGIRQMTAHLARATGKMIRAKALLACAMDQNGLIHPDAVKAAASAELLHLATLVHDDIIDNAGKRRGIDTLHRLFGEKLAVLCGDWLFCSALEFVSSVSSFDNRRENADMSFPRYMSEVCLGEIRQNYHNKDFSLSEREYFRIIRGKTAALFEACFFAGFMFSGEEEALKDKYTELGSNIGIIFQLADDCADYESTQKVTKKTVLSDYSHGVITLPLIYALRTDTTLHGEIEAGMEPSKLKKAVEEAGGLRYTHEKIKRLYKKTAALLDSMHLSAGKDEILSKLLRKSAGGDV